MKALLHHEHDNIDGDGVVLEVFIDKENKLTFYISPEEPQWFLVDEMTVKDGDLTDKTSVMNLAYHLKEIMRKK